MLTKPQTNRVATCAHDGFARTIRPVHTQADGDTVFALATGARKRRREHDSALRRRGGGYCPRHCQRRLYRRHAVIGLGIDICHIERIGKALRKGEGFLLRYYTVGRTRIPERQKDRAAERGRDVRRQGSVS